MKMTYNKPHLYRSVSGVWCCRRGTLICCGYTVEAAFQSLEKHKHEFCHAYSGAGYQPVLIQIGVGA